MAVLAYVVLPDLSISLLGCQARSLLMGLLRIGGAAPPNRPVKQEAESVWCRLARISRRTRSDRSPFRSNADDLFACSLQALRSHRDQSGTLRRSPMSATEVATIIKLQPTARAYRIIPLCTRGRSICLQQTELIASQAVSYYCFIPRPPAPCAPPAPYGPGSAPAALAPYLPLGRLQCCAAAQM